MPEKVAPLPVSAASMEEEEEKKHAPADPPPPPLPGVHHVAMWALLNVIHIAYSIGYALIPPSWLRPRRRHGPTLVALALAVGMLLCVQCQTAVAAQALTVPRGRRRLLLAYAALVATAAGHSLWAVLHGMFVAEDGGLCFSTAVTTAVIFILVVGDLLCFLGLVLRGREEEEEGW